MIEGPAGGRSVLISVLREPNRTNYRRVTGQNLSDHDLCSVMHYSPRTATPPWFKLTAKGRIEYNACKKALPANCTHIGQRCQFSAVDLASLRALYKDVPQ